MIEEVASDDPASSAGPAGGASSSTVAADDGAGVLPVVILGHPMLRAPGDVSLNEAKGAAHGDVLCRESGGIIDEWRRLLQWASMLKERTTAERARAEAR
jgi:hypothetical protein